MQPHNADSIGLFGLTIANCECKRISVEKTANTLIPISYALYKPAFTLISTKGISEVTIDLDDSIISHEKAYIGDAYQNIPPNDICVTYKDNEKPPLYLEAKVVHFMDTKTELILRQDCYACNCLIHVLRHNECCSAKLLSLQQILNPVYNVQETPYLYMLIYKQVDNDLQLELMAFTDVMVMKMIYEAGTPRSREAQKLIDQALVSFHEKGKFCYKPQKGSTVPHQKVSLFPMRSVPCLKAYSWSFPVPSSALVLAPIRPDTSFWQIESRLYLERQISALKKENETLKGTLAALTHAQCNGSQSHQP